MHRRIRTRHTLETALVHAAFEVTQDIVCRLALGSLFAIRCCLAASIALAALVRLLAVAAWEYAHPSDRTALLAGCRHAGEAVRSLPRRARRCLDVAVPVVVCRLVRAVRAVEAAVAHPTPRGVVERRGELRRLRLPVRAQQRRAAA